MNVYCFGNEFLENDSLAKEIADEINIEGVEFIKCNDPSELLEETDILILDVVEEIDKVIVIDDIEQLKNNSIMSLHDFDLSFFLKLMKQTSQLKQFKIIGIPMKGDKEKIKTEVIKNIKMIRID
jgi:Ni,Fe-hydrogenase maturation factor